MGFLDRTLWRLVSSPPRDPFVEKSPKLLAMPSRLSVSKFSMHSGNSSSSSSAASLASSSSTFWMSPKLPSRWSYNRYIPSSLRNNLSKRQMAVSLCLLLALLIWVIPTPGSFQRQVIHITVTQPASSPYQVLRPISPALKKNAPDPINWLRHNSNNKNAYRTANTASPFAKFSIKPRAALISLVRNSELAGIMQSMRQLEYQWNRKYNYPWIFFNDEPFSDEFKVERPAI